MNRAARFHRPCVRAIQYLPSPVGRGENGAEEWQMKEPVGFVGLGGMGAAMAANLLRAGFPLRVYNRSPEKAEPLVALGAVAVRSPAETVEPGGIAVTMVADDRAVEEVTLGPGGLLQRLGDGGVHLSMSTIAPKTSQRLAALHQDRGARYLAAPVFGKPEVAAQARLWVLVAGDAAARARVLPVLQALGRQVFDFGDEPAAANVVKLAGNFLIGAAVEAMAEAFTLCQKHGVPRTRVHELFAQTLFDCFVYRSYGQLVAEERYEPVGAKPSLIRKDYGLILEAARDGLAPLPLAQLIHDRLTATVAKGRDAIDWAGFAREVSESAGL
jgi:3-hydroxyisobutyrate dehydrogenase-like beta-hydroxyacid dehydrogenase